METLVSIILASVSALGTGILSLVLWSLRAQGKQIAQEETASLSDDIDIRLAAQKREIEDNAKDRWANHNREIIEWREQQSKLAEAFIKNLNLNHDASARRIDLLERSNMDTINAIGEIKAIKAILERVEEKVDRLDGNAPR